MLISVIFNCVFVLIATGYAIRHAEMKYYRRIKNLELTIVFIFAWIDSVTKEENFCINQLTKVYEEFKEKGLFL